MHGWFSASSVLTAVCSINFMTAPGRGCVITRYWTSVTPAGRIRCLVLGFEWVCFGWGNLVGGLFRGSEGTEIARIGGI